MVFIENDKIKLENELRDNIKNADEVLIAVAYLRKSGFQLVKDEIIDLIKRGGRIRIIAGPDFGFTEPEALNELKKIGAQIKVYSGEVLFHPKCYIFTSANTNKAIVGSSNLSGSALNAGVEWNVLIDDSDILNKITSVRLFLNDIIYFNYYLFDQDTDIFNSLLYKYLKHYLFFTYIKYLFYISSR